MRSLVKTPAQWATDAATTFGLAHPYRIAKNLATESIGKDNAMPNPHYQFWKGVIDFIEKTVSPGEYSPSSEQTIPLMKGEKQ